MRINVNIDQETLKRIDECAKSLSLSRSAFISCACCEKMEKDAVIKLFNTSAFQKALKDSLKKQK